MVRDIDKLTSIGKLLDRYNDKTMLNIVKRLCNYWLYNIDHPGFDDGLRKRYSQYSDT